MTLQGLYAAIGGDYDGVLGRLMHSEKMVQKFVLKFLSDKSYATLVESMDAADYKEAFRAAHTIKGVCQNLGFTELYNSSGELSEALRNGPTPEAPALLERVSADYRRVAGAIEDYQKSL